MCPDLYSSEQNFNASGLFFFQENLYTGQSFGRHIKSWRSLESALTQSPKSMRHFSCKVNYMEGKVTKEMKESERYKVRTAITEKMELHVYTCIDYCFFSNDSSQFVHFLKGCI